MPIVWLKRKPPIASNTVWSRPRSSWTLRGKGGATRQLLLGDDTPAGGDVYAALASDPRVFTIASYNKSSLAKNLNDLRDKSLLTLNADKVSRVELLKKGEDLEFDRTKDGWQILKPSSSPADSSTVNDLVRTLTSAKMDLSDGPAMPQRNLPGRLRWQPQS